MNKLLRIAAFMIDHIIISFIGVLVFFSLSWESFFDPSESNLNRPFEIAEFLIFPFMILYLFKDIFKGKSIGKRILRLAVRDSFNDQVVPTNFKLLLRNVTIIIWPIEAILVLFTNKRIGDFISKTQVIKD